MICRKLVKICFSLIFISSLTAEPLVQVSEGFLRGSIQISRKGRQYSNFLGIPYAQAPVGELRFRNPLPAKPWKGIRNATTDGSQCPQFLDYSKQYVGNEDCLFLNIHTPLLQFNSTSINYPENGKLLPVMAWIYGGGFFRGNCSSSTFGGSYLLDKDIIYVCMNYRLGILGFLSSGDEASPGNYGLKDQNLALKWIKKNIRAFGGDPERVTIFGESAGAVSVHLHVLSDASNGLFHQYIMQSGNALFPWGYDSRESKKICIETLAMVMFCPRTSTTHIVECLRRKRIDNLLSDSYKFENIARFALKTWTPTEETEAEGAFLVESPQILIEKGKMKDFPFISGTVKDEGLIASMYELTYLFPATPASFGLHQNLNYSQTDDLMIDTMVELWTNFAINGKPTLKNLKPPDLWESYRKNKSYLKIGNTTTLETNFLKERMDFWKNNDY